MISHVVVATNEGVVVPALHVSVHEGNATKGFPDGFDRQTHEIIAITGKVSVGDLIHRTNRILYTPTPQDLLVAEQIANSG